MVTLNDIAVFLENKGALLVQKGHFDTNHIIVGPRNNEDAVENQFTFFNAKAGETVYSKISNSNAALIILEDTLEESKMNLPSLARVYSCTNAKKFMLDTAKFFFLTEKEPLVHASAIIDPSVSYGESTYIHPGVVIEKNVQIGTFCILEPNVYIQENTIIGNRVHIKANTVIGGNGFGYVKQENGEYEHLPHFGRVIIEDNVHIGSNTCIDRGSFSDTILKRGVKIDNLVHIAHNVEIGENSLIIANSMIAGSVRIGENCWIAPSASIRNGLEIGKNVTVGMSSLVLKNISDNETVAGIPAKPMNSKTND